MHNHSDQKDYQMTEFQSENSVIWHSLELAEGGTQKLIKFLTEKDKS